MTQSGISPSSRISATEPEEAIRHRSAKHVFVFGDFDEMVRSLIFDLADKLSRCRIDLDEPAWRPACRAGHTGLIRPLNARPQHTVPERQGVGLADMRPLTKVFPFQIETLDAIVAAVRDIQRLFSV